MASCRVLVFGAQDAGKTYLLNGVLGRRQFDFNKDGEQVYEDTAQGYTLVEVPDYGPDKVAARLESEAQASQMFSCVFVVKPENGHLRVVDGAVLKMAAARADVPKLRVVMPMGPKVLADFNDDVYRRCCARPEHLDKVHLYPLLMEQGFDDSSVAVPRLPGDFKFDFHPAEPHQRTLFGCQPQQEVGPSFQEGFNTIIKGFSEGLSMMGKATTQHVVVRKDAVAKSLAEQNEALTQKFRDSTIGQYASTAAGAVQQFDSDYKISDKVDQHVLSPARDYAAKTAAEVDQHYIKPGCEQAAQKAAEVKSSLDRTFSDLKNEATKQCDEGKLRLTAK